MLARSWLGPWSLRGRLSVTALAGLTTTVVLTVLLFLTAQSASEVVTTAHRTHDRVRVFTQLQAVAREYQNNSYASVTMDSAQGQRAVSTARDQLQRLLDEAARLPASEARERAISQLIADQGMAVLEYYREPSALAARVNRVDHIYQTEGSVKAMREVERITQPIRALQRTLDGEIHRGNGAVASATKRAQSLIRTAVYASLGGLLLALLFSLAVQYLLQLRLRPALRQLEEGANAFGQGNLDHRV